jgi:hypothetical protein
VRRLESGHNSDHDAIQFGRQTCRSETTWKKGPLESTADSRLAGHQITHLSWNSKFQCRIQNSSPMNLILSQYNPVQNITPYFSKIYFNTILQPTHLFRVGVAQSVEGLITDWTTRVRSPGYFSNLCVQTGSGAHLASCTMGTANPFPGGKAWSRRDADTHPPSSAEVKNEELYLLSPEAPPWHTSGQLYFALLSLM